MDGTFHFCSYELMVEKYAELYGNVHPHFSSVTHRTTGVNTKMVTLVSLLKYTVQRNLSQPLKAASTKTIVSTLTCLTIYSGKFQSNTALTTHTPECAGSQVTVFLYFISVFRAYTLCMLTVRHKNSRSIIDPSSSLTNLMLIYTDLYGRAQKTNTHFLSPSSCEP